MKEYVERDESAARSNERRNRPYFPMFVNLSDRKILVVGGGAVAFRKTKTLLRFCRVIHVVALEIRTEFYDLANPEPAAGQSESSGENGMASGQVGQQIEMPESDCKMIFHRRAYEEADLADTDVAIIATDDTLLNEQIALQCRQQGILCNVASDRSLCDFYFPAVIEQDGTVIGIGSSGDPAKSRRVREKLDEFFSH